MSEKRTATDLMLDRVAWVPIAPPPEAKDGIPYATHTGILQIGEMQMHCYQLSDGSRVFDRADVYQFFGITEAEWNELFG